MMTGKCKQFLSNFIKYFLFIAVFTQIVVGTVYFACHFCVFKEYPETKELVQAAETLVFDEYIGFLYPLLLRGSLSIQKITGIGYYIFIYFIQTLFFLGSSFYMIRSFWNRKRAIVGCLYVISFPFCMQSILAISPFAMKASWAFFMAGAMIRIYKKKQGICVKSAVVLACSYLLAAFTQPDDLYVWILPILVLTFVLFGRKKEVLSLWKKVGIGAFCICLFLTGFLVQDRVIQKETGDRMQKNVYSAMFQRTWWPNFGEKYGFLPEELKMCITKEEAISSNQYAEYITKYIGPKIERQFGTEKANELYKRAILSQLSYNKRAILQETAKDFTGYLLEPYTTVWHMSGQNGNAFGRLYSLMSAGKEKQVYVYFCISFVALFSVTFCGMLSVVKRRTFQKKGMVKKVCFGLALLGYQALYYTLFNVQGVDYRYVLFQTGVYLLWALKNSLFFETNKV